MEEGNHKKTSADGGHVENNGKKAEEEHLASIDVGHSKSNIMAHHAVGKEDFMFAVKKKNGETESFSLKKISNAILKAFMRIKDNEEELRPETEEKAEKESPLGLKDDEKEELRSEIAREKLTQVSDLDFEVEFIA